MGAASFVVKLGIVVPAFTCTYIYLLVDCNYVRQVSFKMSPGLSIGTVGQIKIGMYFSCQILCPFSGFFQRLIMYSLLQQWDLQIVGRCR